MRELLDGIGKQSVFVIGDLYLDHYIFGTPQRVSREAPVLVLDEDHHEYRLGGGAAPALALRELGCEVAVGGVVGDDPEGEQIVQLLQDAGIDADHVTIDSTRPTTTKTRVVAQGFLLFPQQLVRVDRQERDPISSNVERVIGRAIRDIKPEAVLVSDYRSGVVTDSLIEHVLGYRGLQGALATVDSQGELERFPGFDLVKCNQGEAEAVLGQTLGSRKTRERLLSELRRKLDAGCLVVTRGDEGASIATASNYDEVPAPNRSEVFDVTGAGDTVVALMTAGMLAGGTPAEAAKLGQLAAGIVIRKWGNAQASREEILDAIEDRD
ncbi:MAG: bifunctional heptose 7-phosphate kinase/heptose 1-phosphate adenyltransferase [Chloroflexota bacterium]